MLICAFFSNAATSCADLESFVKGAKILTMFFPLFVLMRGERIQIPLYAAGHIRPANDTPFKMAFRWRADYGPTLTSGLKAL